MADTDDSMETVRFRGGVLFSYDGWHVVIELAGRRYMDSVSFSTEKAALEAYQQLRSQIIDKLAAFAIGPNRGGYTEIE